MDILQAYTPHAAAVASIALVAFVVALLRKKTGISIEPKREPVKTIGKGSGWLQVAPDGRKWGHWIPSDFRMPPIPADPDFDLVTTKPPLYRAWKYKHTVTMDAKNMDWEKWIELDNQFPRYHALRKARVAERGKRIYGVLPGAEDAARELLLELSEFLSQRYPSVYTVTRRKGLAGSWFNEPNEICKVEIPPLGESYDFDEMDDPMLIAGMITPTDLAIMVEGEDSLYYMNAGFIALAGTWRFEDKIGKDLYYIHTSGHVPEYRSKLDLPMTRYHQKLTPEQPGRRNNYTLTVDRGQEEIAWATSTKGPEDVFDQSTKGPSADSLEAQSFKLPERITHPTQIQIRQERQSLRRLPRTGAVVFSIHSYAEPVGEIVADPGVAGRLASAIKSWKGEVDAHKSGKLYKEILVPYLEGLHRKQVEAGLTTDEPDPAWQYPY